MKVDVRGRDLDVSDALRAYTQRRLDFAIGSFDPRIIRAEVCIADVNGPKGGVDKVCAIAVCLVQTGWVFATADSASAYSAVDGAASRIRTVIARGIRTRQKSRSRAYRWSVGEEERR
jgi:putative sigma-54 modulation protein